MHPFVLLLRSLSFKDEASLLDCRILFRDRSPRYGSHVVTTLARTTGIELTDQQCVLIRDILDHRTSRFDSLMRVKVNRSVWSASNVLYGLVEVLLDHDVEFLEKCPVSSVCTFLTPFRDLEHSKAIKLLKYVTCYWLAFYWHDELPKAPWANIDPWAFRGRVRQYIKRNAARRHSAVLSKLFYSLLQAKRCCDAVTDEFIEQALREHRAALSRSQEPVPVELVDQINEKADEIIRDWTKFRVRDIEPSLSACWETSRAAGGQVARLRSVFSSEYALLQLREVRPGVVINHFGWTWPNAVECIRIAYFEEFGLSASDFNESRPSAGMMQCMVAAICEPLKVRNVTKGRAAAYYAVHCVQKWMHSNLRQNPIFKLIGEPATEAVVGEFLAKLQGKEFLVSGDYSAATDNLKIDVTKLIFERVLYRLRSDVGWSFAPMLEGEYDAVYGLCELARKVLYEHEIHYPKDFGIDPIVQTTGQLMGSPLSFPILCMANLICYWIAIAPEKKMSELLVLVNGDDIGFGADKVEYARWEAMLPKFGFVKSVGKNYVNKRFLIINSDMFDREFERTGRCLVPYFCSGLLMGRSKVAKDENLLDRPPAVVGLELCLRGSNNPSRTFERFMVWHKEDVEKITAGKLNLFLPMERGGLGLNGFGVKVKSDHGDNYVTLWQRRYAAYVASQETLRLSCFVREADEAGRWQRVRRVRDDCRPVSQELASDLGYFPQDERDGLMSRLYQCTKQYLAEKQVFGPPGWRVVDYAGVTRWKNILSGATLRKVSRCKPLNDVEMKGIPQYRYVLD